MADKQTSTQKMLVRIEEQIIDPDGRFESYWKAVMRSTMLTVEKADGFAEEYAKSGERGPIRVVTEKRIIETEIVSVIRDGQAVMP